MSSGVLGQYKDQFVNVYQKGALIAMCIDIKLLELSNGKYGFMNLMQDLSARYGKQKGFKDEELFDEIGKLTYPEIEKFLQTYVSGNEPLPLEQVFNSVGVSFQPKVETKDSVFSMGRIGLGFDRQTKRLVVTDIADMNDFGKLWGIGRTMKLFRSTEWKLTQATAQEYFKNFQTITKAGEDFIVKVKRKDDKGEDKVVELKGVMVKSPIVKFNVLEFSATATPEQLTLRNYWLKPNGIQVN